MEGLVKIFNSETDHRDKPYLVIAPLREPATDTSPVLRLDVAWPTLDIL